MDLLTLAVVAAQTVAPLPAPLVVPPPAPAVAVAAELQPDGAVSAGPVLTARFTPLPLPALPAGMTLLPAPRDTVIEYSAAYYRRLDIHRWGSYAMLPLFAFQYAAGRELFDKSSTAPAWAREGHGIAATGVAALFGVNTVTGVWNLYEGWNDPQEHGRKVFHAAMMMLADAGFVATGILADEAEDSSSNRELHRTVALTSIGVATIGWASMLDIFR